MTKLVWYLVPELCPLSLVLCITRLMPPSTSVTFIHPSLPDSQGKFRHPSRDPPYFLGSRKPRLTSQTVWAPLPPAAWIAAICPHPQLARTIWSFQTPRGSHTSPFIKLLFIFSITADVSLPPRSLPGPGSLLSFLIHIHHAARPLPATPAAGRIHSSFAPHPPSWRTCRWGCPLFTQMACDGRK